MQQITAQQLKDKLEAPGAKPMLLDVREPWEFQICSIAGSTHIPMGQIPARLKELSKESEIVAICHYGNRSQQAALFLENQGFKNLYNLQGGVDAWGREIDPKMNKY